MSNNSSNTTETSPTLAEQCAALVAAAARHRVSTAGLLSAACAVEEAILDMLPEDLRDVRLPRDYYLIREYPHWYLARPAEPEHFEEYCASALDYSIITAYPVRVSDDEDRTIGQWQITPRDELLSFAADIRDGLIGEIAAFIARRAAVAEHAAATLAAALPVSS